MEDAPVKLIVKVEKRGRQRGEKRPKKLVFLDGEFAKEIKQVKEERPEHFSCWRCQSEKTSRIHFVWSTSQGVKTLCNGCNGQLIGKRPKVPKAPGGPKDVAATAAQSGAEAEEAEEVEAEEPEEEAEEEEESAPPRKEQRKKKRPKKSRED